MQYNTGGKLIFLEHLEALWLTLDIFIAKHVKSRVLLEKTGEIYIFEISCKWHETRYFVHR